MAIPAPAHPPGKDGAFGTALVVALTLVLAWQLAHWTWKLALPGAAPSARAQPAAEVDLAAIARLFGASAPGASSTADGLVLKGVVAPTPGVAASAIFAPRAGRDISVFIGGEVTPGTTLAEVDPDHVIVSRGGVRSRIDLATRGPGAAAPRAAAAARGFRLDVSRSGENGYSLSRHELDEALRDPGQLQYLGQIVMPPGGGVRMESAPVGSLAAKLGLRSGDVIRKINGQPVASTGDLARLYQQFGSLSTVQAEIQRGSATVHLSYQIH
ncbi:MAG TPA: type II secretion system protein N [Usitatibacter sp.]|nr:type II secretion system protein N [Usitatibacter sp.]